MKEKEGFKGRDLETSKNSAELIVQHMKATGGKIRCRFPPGRIVSLKCADVVRCDEVVCDEKGEVREVRCTVLSEEEAKGATANKKRKLGSMHWLAGGGASVQPPVPGGGPVGAGRLGGAHQQGQRDRDRQCDDRAVAGKQEGGGPRAVRETGLLRGGQGQSQRPHRV